MRHQATATFGSMNHQKFKLTLIELKIILKDTLILAKENTKQRLFTNIMLSKKNSF